MLNSKLFLFRIAKNCLTRCLSSGTKYPLVKFTKVVHPEDTQMVGMVQGGLMLKLLEASADIAATKHCMRFGIKDENGNVPHPALVGVERVEFLGSGEVGTLLEFSARIIQVRNRSLRIYVDVYSLRSRQERNLVNRALLWYVPINTTDGSISHFHLTDEEKAKLASMEKSLGERVTFNEPEKYSMDGYLRLSMQEYLDNLKMAKDTKIVEDINKAARKILLDEESKVTMYSVSPSHCGLLNRCRAGEILRWMDEYAASLMAFSINRLVVTGSVDSCIMSRPIPPGSCISFVSRPVFSSSRTMDLQVIGCMENKDSLQPQVFTSSFFTLVVPRRGGNDDFVVSPVKTETEEAKQLFEKRKVLHLARKAIISKYKQG